MFFAEILCKMVFLGQIFQILAKRLQLVILGCTMGIKSGETGRHGIYQNSAYGDNATESVSLQFAHQHHKHCSNGFICILCQASIWASAVTLWNLTL